MFRFSGKSVNIKKILNYGFVKSKSKYVFSTKILDGQFNLTISIDKDNNINTELVEIETGEIYTLHLLEGVSGNFVGQVRAEYDAVLEDIKEKCFENSVFEWDYTYKIIDYAKEKYSSGAEYLWEKFPRNAVCRRNDNKKWFLALLSVNGTKIGLERDEIVELIDLRVPVDDVPNLIQKKNIYPAYHMNKKHWITILLDGSMPIEEIYGFVDKSYELAKHCK